MTVPLGLPYCYMLGGGRRADNMCLQFTGLQTEMACTGGAVQNHTTDVTLVPEPALGGEILDFQQMLF